MRRWIAQAAWFLITNLHLTGFVSGRIYQGPLKRFCVPGLNCYSCPGALGACPIGALQALAGDAKRQLALYALGFLTLFGAALGRFVCGWLCPFGLVQELLFRIRARKVRVAARIDAPLRYLKYAVLLVLVILMPMLLLDAYGLSTPWFCQLVCPSGTLFGGIPLLIANPTLRQAVGLLFGWKALVLLAVAVFSALIYRPFCKYLCPLGAVYALFNRISLVRMSLDQHKCTRCGACAKACQMQVPVPEQPNHPECIRCGDCRRACPTGALTLCGGKRDGAGDGKNEREA